MELAQLTHFTPPPQPSVWSYQFEGHQIRLVEKNGEPWFVASDACAALGIANSRDALLKLDPDERGVGSTDTLGGPQNVGLVSESGLYTLILRCRDAVVPGKAPHRFRRWVTGEVLPAVRRGTLRAVDPMTMLNDPEALRGMLLNYSEKVLHLEAENATMAPKVDAFERIAASEGSFCITDAAKTLQVQPNSLFKFLRSHLWIYRRAGAANDVAYQSKLASGLLEHKTTTVTRSDGSEKSVTQVRVTPKGLARLAQEFQPAVAPA